jgi:hypothetical protein
MPTISDAKRWWARHRPAPSRVPLAFAHPTTTAEFAIVMAQTGCMFLAKGEGFGANERKLICFAMTAPGNILTLGISPLAPEI